VETLWCLANGDTFSFAFPIDMNISCKTIGHLKDSIREKIGVPYDVKAKDIELWRVNSSFEEFKENAIVLDNIEVKQKLLIPTAKVKSVFDDKMNFFFRNFIVKVPNTTTAGKYFNKLVAINKTKYNLFIKYFKIDDYVSRKLEFNDVASKRQKLLHG
jgi:hypothetical protein